MKNYILKSDGHEPQFGEKISYTVNNDTSDATIRKYVSVTFSPTSIQMLLDDGIIEEKEKPTHEPIDFTDDEEQEVQNQPNKPNEPNEPNKPINPINSNKPNNSYSSTPDSSSPQEEDDEFLDLLLDVLTHTAENIRLLNSRQDTLDKKIEILNTQISNLKKPNKPTKPIMPNESIEPNMPNEPNEPILSLEQIIAALF